MKTIRQIENSFSKEEVESDEEERDFVEPLDEIVAHTINLNEDKTSLNSEQNVFWNKATVNYPTSFSSFTAQHSGRMSSYCRQGLTFCKWFWRILVDTGAEKGSPAGRVRYQAYCATTYQDPRADLSRAAHCHFSIVSAI